MDTQKKIGRRRSSVGFSLSFIVLLLSTTPGIASKERSVMEILEGPSGMVAYGSLISLRSLEESLGHKYAGPIHQVHLLGYERAWASVRPFNDPEAIATGRPRIDAFFLSGAERVPVLGTAELNIFPKEKCRLNGILYLVSDEDRTRLDKREHGYRRVDVTGRVEEFDFRGGKVYAYEGLLSPAARRSPASGRSSSLRSSSTW